MLNCYLCFVKNLVNLLLSACILVSSVGIPVNRHYCMDRLKDVHLFSQASSCNYGKSMAMTMCPVTSKTNSKKGCCHTTRELVKLNNVQNSISHLELVKLFPAALISLVPYFSFFNQTSTTKSCFGFHSPPYLSADKRIGFRSLII